MHLVSCNHITCFWLSDTCTHTHKRQFWWVNKAIFFFFYHVSFFISPFPTLDWPIPLTLQSFSLLAPLLAEAERRYTLETPAAPFHLSLRSIMCLEFHLFTHRSTSPPLRHPDQPAWVSGIVSRTWSLTGFQFMNIAHVGHCSPGLKLGPCRTDLLTNSTHTMGL